MLSTFICVVVFSISDILEKLLKQDSGSIFASLLAYQGSGILTSLLVLSSVGHKLDDSPTLLYIAGKLIMVYKDFECLYSASRDSFNAMSHTCIPFILFTEVSSIHFPNLHSSIVWHEWPSRT